MTFAENVKAKLKQKRMTQNELANLCGMSSSGISTALSGNRNPRIDTMQRIAFALNCTVAELLDDEAPAAAPSDGLTPTERQLIQDFRALNAQGQEFVLQAVAMAGAVSKTGTNTLADLEAQVG